MTMCLASGLNRGQVAGDLKGECCGLNRGHCEIATSGKEFAERGSVDPLGNDDEQSSGTIVNDIEDRDCPAIKYTGRGLGSFAKFATTRVLKRQKSYTNGTLESFVEGTPNRAAGSIANLVDESVSIKHKGVGCRHHTFAAWPRWGRRGHVIMVSEEMFITPVRMVPLDDRIVE
jgi:hypothetical protein